MLLSACLIVKNEELTLNKCLESMEDIVDEIIIVDTGSTDTTMEIARKYTDRIYQFNWTNSFADARNESLRHAQGRYILIIDADEYFDEETKVNLRPFLEENAIAGGFLNVYNYTGHFTGRIDYTPVMLLRIIRNGFYYTEDIHEQVDYRIFKDKDPVLPLPVILHHIGYMFEIVEAKKKRDRNQTILEKLVQQRPDDVFQRLNLAAEFLRYGEFEKGLPLVEQNHREFDIINKLKNKEPVDGNSHLVARNYKFHIIALENLHRLTEAIAIADEALTILPRMTDFLYLKANCQREQGHLLEAKASYQKCLEQGDISIGLYDKIVGSGSFLSHLYLGVLWAEFGDDQLAFRHFTISFFGKPTEAPNMVFYLMHFMPKDENALYNYLESKIIDVETLHNYAEAYVVNQMPNSLNVVTRIEEKKISSVMIERARCAHALQSGKKAFLELVDSHNGIHNYWLAIYYAEMGMYNEAEDYFYQSGIGGINLWESLKPVLLDQSPEAPAITGFLRDLVAMRAEKIFLKWMPLAPDFDECWMYLKYSPFHPLLMDIEWRGDNVHQCEMNAMRLFKSKDFANTKFWIEKALLYPPTVTKILIEADLALAENRVKDATKLLAFGKIVFEESIAIDQALKNLTGSTDAMEILSSARTMHRLEDFFMNPMDAYRKNVVDTMPLNIQLAQLHLRGSALAKQAKADAEAGKVMDVRSRIQEMQEILTFLRSSLDPTLEISIQTDEIYLFYFKMLIRWFVSPKEIPNEYDAFIEFWESWAKTWAKAQVK